MVVDIGPGAEQYTDVSLGDRVATPPGIPCLASRFCNSGHENLCQRRSRPRLPLRRGLRGVHAGTRPSGVQRGLIYRIPDSLSDVEAALAEPLACVVNGQRKNGFVLGDVVLVIGAGPIGLMHLQLARLQGARKVLVSEPSAPRRALAGELGATRTIDPTTTDLIDGGAGGDGRGGADVTVAAHRRGPDHQHPAQRHPPRGPGQPLRRLQRDGRGDDRGEPDPLRRADRHRHQRLHPGGLPHRPRPPGRGPADGPGPWSATASRCGRSSGPSRPPAPARACASSSSPERTRPAGRALRAPEGERGA